MTTDREAPGGAEVTPGASGDMDPEEFRRYGYQVVDWIAEYFGRIEEYPVLSRVEPGAVKAQLPEAYPVEPEALDRILADFERVVLPGITHWNHPGFFAYFGISGSGPGILGELLTAALTSTGCSGRPRLRRPSWRSGRSTGCARCSACRTPSGA